jgi:hypothetical protein
VRPRSDKTEIQYLRCTLRNVGRLLEGVLTVTEGDQEHVNYCRKAIREALAPKRRRPRSEESGS